MMMFRPHKKFGISMLVLAGLAVAQAPAQPQKHLPRPSNPAGSTKPQRANSPRRRGRS